MTMDTQPRMLVLLFVLMMAFFAVVGYRFYQMPLLPSAGPVSPNQPLVSTDDITGVELIDINFWEARFKVHYAQNSARSGGYLTVTEIKQWSPNVGIMTQPGIHEGVTLLTRKFGNTGGYAVDEVVASMYDPYRADHNFALKKFPLQIKWPSVEGIEAYSPSGQLADLASVRQVVIYRNVPNYVAFAERLTASGYPPERIYMMLAVCPNCQGGLIYGGGVSFAQLQVVLKVLHAHQFPLATVFYDPTPAAEGIIHIGNSPPPGSKPLWANIDGLLAADNEHDFFALMDFPLAAPAERAKDLVAKARRYIDAESNMADARRMLDEALALDDSLVPVYLEMARHTMKTEPFSEDVSNDQIKQTAAKAEEFIQSGLSIDPNHADAHVLLGYVKTVQRDFADAKRAFDRAEKFGTTSLWLHYNRALMYQLQGDSTDARRHYEKLLAFDALGDDNDRPLRVGLRKLARAYLQDGDVDKAFATYDRLRAQFPSFRQADSEYLTLLIAHGSDQGKIQQVINACGPCYGEIAPHINAMTTVLEAASLASNDREKAVRAIIKARSFRSDFPTVIADLLKGGAGRDAVSSLIQHQLLEIPTIEKNGSVIAPLLAEATLEGMELALKNGANPNVLTGYENMSPLMYAVAMQRLEVIAVLLNYGGDPALENSFGLSAYSLARSLNNPELMMKLGGVKNRL